MYKEELLERFLRYVKINTCSDETSDTIPSTKHQFDLADILKDELLKLGIKDAYVDEHCYVYGHLEATKGHENDKGIAFIAHMDTVSDFCMGRTINPIIHENYDGEDIALKDRVIKVSDYPHLKEMKGCTLITGDGTTVLGADDKAGIAEIMTMISVLQKENIPHGRICIAFTPDEEIGSGADLLDLERLGAAYGFTADGDTEGVIEYENFNAASTKIDIKGVNIHPGDAKDIMINAAAVSAEFQSELPMDESPRNTNGYEGFYHLLRIEGTVESAHMDYIIRDHDKNKFEERKEMMLSIAKKLNKKYADGTVKITITDSYYNMEEMIRPHMYIIERAKKAVLDAGLASEFKPVRGGTDGSKLSFRGLPCPNLGTGGHAFHGPYEHISLDGMQKATEILVNIAKAE